jgi:hypothetical protein
VSRRAGNQRNALEVQVVCEPSRLAAECLVTAYERLVPMARRAVAPGSHTMTAPQERRRSHAGGAQG